MWFECSQFIKINLTPEKSHLYSMDDSFSSKTEIEFEALDQVLSCIMWEIGTVGYNTKNSYTCNVPKTNKTRIFVTLKSHKLAETGRTKHLALYYYKNRLFEIKKQQYFHPIVLFQAHTTNEVTCCVYCCLHTIIIDQMAPNNVFFSPCRMYNISLNARQRQLYSDDWRLREALFFGCS